MLSIFLVFLLRTKYMCVLVCQSCYNKIPQCEWLQHRNLFSHSPRGVGRVAFSQGLSSFVDGHLLIMSSHGLPLCANTRCVCPLSYKDTSHTILEPPPTASLGPYIQIQFHSEVLRVGISTYEFWAGRGAQCSPQ